MSCTFTAFGTTYTGPCPATTAPATTTPPPANECTYTSWLGTTYTAPCGTPQLDISKMWSTDPPPPQTTQNNVISDAFLKVSAKNIFDGTTLLLVNTEIRAKVLADNRTTNLTDAEITQILNTFFNKITDDAVARISSKYFVYKTEILTMLKSFIAAKVGVTQYAFYSDADLLSEYNKFTANVAAPYRARLQSFGLLAGPISDSMVLDMMQKYVTLTDDHLKFIVDQLSTGTVSVRDSIMYGADAKCPTGRINSVTLKKGFSNSMSQICYGCSDGSEMCDGYAQPNATSYNKSCATGAYINDITLHGSGNGIDLRAASFTCSDGTSNVVGTPAGFQQKIGSCSSGFNKKIAVGTTTDTYFKKISLSCYSELTELKLAYDALVKTKSELDSQITTINAQLTTANQQLEQKSQAYKNMLEERNQIWGQLSLKTADYNDLVGVKNKLDAQIIAINNQLNGKTSMYENLLKIKNELDAKLADVTKQLAQKTDEYKLLSDKKTALDVELTGINQLLEQKNTAYGKLEKLFNGLFSENKTLQGNYDKLLKTKNDLDAQLTDVNQQLSATKEKLKQANEDLEKEKKTAADLLAGVRADLDLKTKQFDLLQAEYKAYKINSEQGLAAQIEKLKISEKLGVEALAKLAEVQKSLNESLTKNTDLEKSLSSKMLIIYVLIFLLIVACVYAATRPSSDIPRASQQT